MDTMKIFRLRLSLSGEIRQECADSEGGNVIEHSTK